MRLNTFLSAALLLVALSSCKDTPKDVTRSDQRPPIFPDYTEVTIPVGIAPLNFNVVPKEEAERVDVTIRGSRGGEMHVNGEWAEFDEDAWHSLVEQNVGGRLTVTVCAKWDGRWTQYEDFNIYVSKHHLDAWGLTYRLVAPGYEVYSRMGIYQRDISTFDEYAITDNSETYGMCVNCHTSNRTNPKQLVFHARGEHGGTYIERDGKHEWLKANNEVLGGAMVYPYWHPSGRYCAFSTNQTRQAFHVADTKRIEVFDISSDVFVFDPATHAVITDSLLSSKEWSENCPAFSPDGRTLYYITCRQQTYPMHYKDEQYNLCRIGFDPERGTFGNVVDTLFNAVAMGKSLTWPKPSYDGRYVMFTLQDYGYFGIWHDESDKWLLDLATGKARPLDEMNSNKADSYHNWSADSHWVVFTSRRQDGLYTQLFLSSIDDNGRATKPFLLPQRNPLEYYRRTLYSFNVPDFTSEKVKGYKKRATH